MRLCLTLAAVLAVALLLSSGTPAGTSESFSAWNASFLVSVSGGHFAQDGPELDLMFNLGANSSPPARITIYVPAGFELYPNRPLGSVVGTATLFAADYAGGSVTRTVVDGEITATTFGAQEEQSAQACSPGAHLARWLLSLSVLGQPADVPIYVAGSEAGGLQLDICPPSFAGDGKLPIAQLQLALPDLELPSARGTYLWRSVVTPLAPDRRTPLSGKAYELRSLVYVPYRLTLKGAYALAAHKAVVHGSLTALGKPRPDVRIFLVKLVRKITPTGSLSDDTIVGVTRTKKDGSFSFRVTLRRTAGFIAIAADTAQACTGASGAPGGCLSTTTAGITSDPVTVSVR